MTAICPAWKQSVFEDAEKWAESYIRELVESLIRNGITTRQQARIGLSALKARQSPFLPNPDVFAELCNSAALEGLPTRNAAFRMAVDWPRLKPEQRHGAVFAAMREMDMLAFRRATVIEADKMFDSAWCGVVDRCRLEGMDWLPDIPPPPPGLEYQPLGARAAPDHARAAMRGIMDSLN